MPKGCTFCQPLAPGLPASLIASDATIEARSAARSTSPTPAEKALAGARVRDAPTGAGHRLLLLGGLQGMLVSVEWSRHVYPGAQRGESLHIIGGAVKDEFDYRPCGG